MINEMNLKSKIIKKIEEIPAEKLNEIYKLLNSFNFKISKNIKRRKINSFAGIWKDIPDDIFQSFTNKLHERRKATLKRRIL